MFDNFRFIEAADAYYLADQLAPDMPYAEDDYPVAMALWNVLIASKDRQHAVDRRVGLAHDAAVHPV